MPKKVKKHPKDMTDDEAIKHLFHPKIVKAVKRHLEVKHGKASNTSK
jgi:hypothetical protein